MLSGCVAPVVIAGAFLQATAAGEAILARLGRGATRPRAVRDRLIEIAQDIFPREQQTPEALGAYQKAEIEEWWPIIEEAGSFFN
jgi:hypothetical protein